MTSKIAFALVCIAKPKRVKEKTVSLESEEFGRVFKREGGSEQPQETSSYSTFTSDVPVISIVTVSARQPTSQTPLPETTTSKMSHPLGPTSLMQGMMFPFTNPMFFQPRVPLNSKTDKPMNYRTVPCRNFHSPAGCERGDNCHFIHDFGSEGRPISNINDWKRSNEIRQKNLKTMQGLGQASYYPPAGPEPHLPTQRRPS
jgi:hypothetical protein